MEDRRGEIERVRRRGHAIVDEELEPGLRPVAAPVHDAAGAVTAAVNLSVQASRTTVADMKRRLLPPLREDRRSDRARPRGRRAPRSMTPAGRWTGASQGA